MSNDTTSTANKNCNIKILFLFKIQDLRTGKVFYGIHASEDPYFATPRCSLADISTYEHVLDRHLTRDLRQLIYKTGKQYFTIESLLSGTKETLLKHKNIYVNQAIKNNIALNRVHDLETVRAWRAIYNKLGISPSRKCPLCNQKIRYHLRDGKRLAVHRNCPGLIDNNITMDDIVLIS